MESGLGPLPISLVSFSISIIGLAFGLALMKRWGFFEQPGYFQLIY